MPGEIARFQVGNLPCVMLTDVNDPLTEQDITQMFGANAEPILTAFRAVSEPMVFSVNILLVKTAGKRVLIDTGVGQDDPSAPGHLLDNLRAAGIKPESIDTIIITHYHLDHLRGLTDADGTPMFTRARLVVPRLEHEYWMSEATLAGMDPNRTAKFRMTFAPYESRLTLADSTAEIEPGIRYVPAPGHTPGHSAVLVESQGERLLHIADTVHVPFQLNAMEASPSFDKAPDAAIDTRRALLSRIESEDPLVMVYHFPAPGLGHIRRVDGRLVWVPLTIAE